MVEQQDLDFLYAFRTRRAVISYTLFALNIIIFILMTFAGGTTNDPTLLAFGVKSNFEINNGEIWRLITPVFIHIGLLHLAFNSYALWIVGPQVEKLYGGPRFLLLYLLTGIAGVVASYFYHPAIISAGASGAIFGLFGVLLVFSYKYRKTIPAFFSQALGRGILLTVGINLVIGFMIPQVDNSAHIGGLVAGAMLAMVVPFQRPGATPHRALPVLQGALTLLVAICFFQVAIHYSGPGISFRNFAGSFRGGASTGDFVNAINKAEQAFEESEEALASGDRGRLPFAKENLGKAIDLLEHMPSLSTRADELSADLLDLVRKQYEVVEEASRTGAFKPDSPFNVSKYSRRYERVKRAIDEWAESDGAKYGIRNSK